ncbi:MAG: DUF6371 domain-containing protein [Alistipes sp.]|nr:DUF6371 domain-containing protein [Alistipes sp.]
MTYRYQLERYRGRATRHTCPRCGRKHSFTRYIDTENNNIYIGDDVGKCNRLDKCGYHYPPRQYFADHPWLNDNVSVAFLQNIGKSKKAKATKPSPPEHKPLCTIPDEVFDEMASRTTPSCHMQWLERRFGSEYAEFIRENYYVSSTADGRTIFWQIDAERRIRTGKVMAFDIATGRRKHTPGAVDWVHSILKREGTLPEDWELTQCLYGEHLLAWQPTAVVALVESCKTAHVGYALFPKMLWLATGSLQGLTTERLRPLKGRRVVLFPDQGKGYEVWSSRIAPIAREVGFVYTVSDFAERHLSDGADVADLISNE